MQYNHLSTEERGMIQALYKEKKSLRAIAKALGRPPSTIAREVKRNRYNAVTYLAYSAREKALRRVKNIYRYERVRDGQVRAYVVEKLRLGWSPEQISGRIRIDCPGKRISHEAIYQFVYRRYFQGEEDLRSRLKRRHRKRQRKGDRSVQRLKRLANKPWIDDRPSVVGMRERYGDWEGDTMVSRESSAALMTMAERKSGLVRIRKTSRVASREVSSAMIKVLWPLPLEMRQTLTLDNGHENARWQSVERYGRVDVYFAHPYSSWERESNENANGLIRWYLPKKTDFARISIRTIQAIEDALNNRPRKRLGWRTPLEVFNQSVALRC
jgi:transposase, IS30 family